MKMQNCLPIGSVVKLFDSDKRIMIFGIMQTAVVPEGEITYDYIGVPYPEGNMGQDFQYMFNSSDIERVEFEGFQDVERQTFVEEFGAYIEQQEQEMQQE